jgi:hypothetical protein
LQGAGYADITKWFEVKTCETDEVVRALEQAEDLEEEEEAVMRVQAASEL